MTARNTKFVPLGQVVEFSPRFGKDDLSDDSLASFIPMKCVEEESGRFEPLGDRKVAELRKGYTPFRDGDVIFAKVTPCMENGKAAVLKGLTNGVGFGSTEFFALRPKNDLDAAYLFHFILQSSFRREAARNMTGAVGLRRVPKSWLEQQTIPLPEPDEQRRIVAEIEKQFTRLEAGVAALRRVQANLKRYRAAVLKAACEGRLVPTEDELAKKQKRKFETGVELITRVLTERRQNWQGRGKYKEPAATDTANLPPLPEGWAWATIEQLSEVVRGSSPRPAGDPRYFGGDVPWITVGPLTADNSPYLKSVSASLNELGREHSRYIEPETLLLTNSGATLGVPKITLISGCINDGVAALLGVNYPLKLYLLYFLRTQTERLRGVNQGAAQPNLNTTIIKAINVPLPPPAEQARIVAEVERRLSVVEELESVVSANLQRATRLRQSILQKAFAGELVDLESEKAPSNIIELPKPEPIPRPNAHFARALLSAEIVHRLHGEPTFGRIKHQKIFHLCEHIAQIEEIQGSYRREMFGPFDNQTIYTNEGELRKQKWYRVFDDDERHAYEPLEKAGNHRKYVEKYWPDKLPIIEKLIELMRKWDTDRCEIFCTAYAAWNDLLLWGKQATEDSILHEILERWHDSKKRVPKERWLKAIAWMKKEGFVPTGFGKPTKEAK